MWYIRTALGQSLEFNGDMQQGSVNHSLPLFTWHATASFVYTGRYIDKLCTLKNHFLSEPLLYSRSNFTKLAFCGILCLAPKTTTVLSSQKKKFAYGKMAANADVRAILERRRHLGYAKRNARWRFTVGKSQMRQQTIREPLLSIVYYGLKYLHKSSYES